MVTTRCWMMAEKLESAIDIKREIGNKTPHEMLNNLQRDTSNDRNLRQASRDIERKSRKLEKEENNYKRK